MRIKLVVCYDGTNYCGWQVQPNQITVQQCLENAVEKATGEKVRITGSGRTDAGVHALCQIAHLDTQSSIPADKFYKALNVHLPSDIRVLSSEMADDNFNACTWAKKKTYRYSTYFSDVPIPLKERYAVHLEKKPDVHKMREFASLLTGEHDFKAMSASGSGAKTTVRTVYDITITEKDNDIDFFITGNGFLYNMVRIMVGTLIKAGTGDMQKEELEKMLSSGERSLGGKTLPAKGLCLVKVEYE